MAPTYYSLATDCASVDLNVALQTLTPASIELSPGFESTRYPPNKIFDPFDTGAASFLTSKFKQKQEAISMKLLHDAVVFSQRLVLAQESIHSDFVLRTTDLDAYLRGVADVNPRDHKLSEKDGMFTSEFLDQTPQRLLGLTALITSAEPVNFGAWLIRTLPKIAYLSDTIDLATVNVLCHCDRPWQVALLEWMGIRRQNIIPQQFSRSYGAETLLIPSWPNRSKFLDTRTLAMLESFRIRANSRCSGGPMPKAVYVSRVNWRSSTKAIYRPFPQEEEFEARLQKLGFVSVSPENLSFAEAVRLFSNAEIVLGAQGAGMFNSVFCHPGTKVIEIHHLRSFLHGHPSMYASCGLDYSIILGNMISTDNTMMQKEVAIDLDGTLEFVRGLM